MFVVVLVIIVIITKLTRCQIVTMLGVIFPMLIKKKDTYFLSILAILSAILTVLTLLNKRKQMRQKEEGEHLKCI